MSRPEPYVEPDRSRARGYSLGTGYRAAPYFTRGNIDRAFLESDAAFRERARETGTDAGNTASPAASPSHPTP